MVVRQPLELLEVTVTFTSLLKVVVSVVKLARRYYSCAYRCWRNFKTCSTGFVTRDAREVERKKLGLLVNVLNSLNVNSFTESDKGFFQGFFIIKTEPKDKNFKNYLFRIVIS